MKITVTNQKMLELADEIGGIAGSIWWYWNWEKIQKFNAMNGEKVKKVETKRWAMHEEWCETEEYDAKDGSGKPVKGKRVVYEDVPDIVLSPEDAAASDAGKKKPKKRIKMKEGRTFEEFNAAMKVFMETLVEINI